MSRHKGIQFTALIQKWYGCRKVGALQSQLRLAVADHSEREAHLEAQVKALRTELAMTSIAGEEAHAEVQAVRQQVS